MKVEQLYSYSDIAKLLRISINTVKKYIEEKNVESVQLSSRTVRFAESEVLKLLSPNNNS